MTGRNGRTLPDALTAPRRNKEKTMADGLLQEWGQLMTGKWTIQNATPKEGGALAITNGSHTISWMDGGGALTADCIPPVDSDAVSTGTRWVAVLDSATGQIKQTTVAADGSTAVAYIGKKNGQWGWKQTRTYPNGSTEEDCSTFTVTNGGNTITQHITERVLTSPNSAGGPMGLAETCNVLTRVA